MKSFISRLLKSADGTDSLLPPEFDIEIQEALSNNLRKEELSVPRALVGVEAALSGLHSEAELLCEQIKIKSEQLRQINVTITAFECSREILIKDQSVQCEKGVTEYTGFKTPRN